MLFKVKISARIAATPQGAPTNSGKSYGSFNSSYLKNKKILSRVCEHVFVCLWVFLLEKAAADKPQSPLAKEDEEDVQAAPEAAPTPESQPPRAESSGCSGVLLASSPLPPPRLWHSWEITVSLSQTSSSSGGSGGKGSGALGGLLRNWETKSKGGLGLCSCPILSAQNYWDYSTPLALFCTHQVPFSALHIPQGHILPNILQDGSAFQE